MAQEDVERITALVARIGRERPILMVAHNLSVVASLANHITLLARGKVLAQGDYATVSQDPEVIQAYIGRGHACGDHDGGPAGRRPTQQSRPVGLPPRCLLPRQPPDI